MDRKLRLDLDALAVASFETGDSPAEARGTVKAREDAAPCPSWPESCPGTFHTCASFDRTCRQ